MTQVPLKFEEKDGNAVGIIYAKKLHFCQFPFVHSELLENHEAMSSVRNCASFSSPTKLKVSFWSQTPLPPVPFHHLESPSNMISLCACTSRITKLILICGNSEKKKNHCCYYYFICCCSLKNSNLFLDMGAKGHEAL